MVTPSSRRFLLRGGSAGIITALAGCMAFGPHEYTGPPAGSVLIENTHTVAHQITVAVQEGPNMTVTVSSGERFVRKNFLTSPGTHMVSVRIDSERIGEMEVELFGQNNRPGEVLHITIDAEGDSILGVGEASAE